MASKDQIHFQALLDLPFEEVAVAFRKSDDKTLDKFINYLFTLIDEASDGKMEKIQQTLTLCTWILSGGEEPAKYLNEVKKNSRSKICTKVWNDAYYFYRCRDCEMSPSSSICFDCFKDGKHEGHDFILEKSIYGGCCDCGNPSAWKESGYCCRHSAKGDVPTPDMTLKDLYGITKSLFSALLTIVTKYYIKYNKQKDQSGLLVATAVVKWLRYICQFGEAMISAVRDQCWDTVPFGTPIIEETTNSLMGLPLEPLNQILFLYLDLLQDPNFKTKYAKVYLKLYPQLFLAMLLSQETNIIFKISPQLFSIPALTLPLIRQDGLLDLIIKQVHIFIDQITLKKPPFPTIDLNSVLLSKNYFAYVNDLTMIFGFGEICRYMATERLDLVKNLTSLLLFLQGMNPYSRKKDVHVEFESDSWQTAFNLELDFARITSSSISDGLKYNHEQEIAKYQLAKLTSKEELATYQGIIEIICNILAQWLQSLNLKLVKEKFGNSETVFVSYDVSSEPISFHLPLHRHLAKIIAGAVEKFPMIPLSKLFPENMGFVDIYLDHPLQLQVVLSQIHAEMWIRNGTCMPYQTFMYKSTVFLDFFYYDTFLQQCAIVLMGAEKFLENSLRRFGFFQKWIEAQSVVRTLPEVKLAEHFFRFLIHVLSDRTNLGFNVSQQMRREIVHQLAIQDQTYSAFSAQINSRVVTQKEFDLILASVSDFKQGTPGTYSLKDSCWKEFDLFYLRYLPQTQEKATERFFQKKKTLGSKAVSSSWKLAPLFESFQDLNRLLQAPQLHYLLYLVLIDTQKTPSKCENLLHAVFHLIGLILDNSPVNFDANPAPISALLGKNCFHDANFFFNILLKRENEPSFLQLLIDAYKNSKFGEYKDVLREILSRLHKLEPCTELIASQISEFGKSLSSAESDAAAEMRRKVARERQQSVLASFAKSRKSFLQHTAELSDQNSMESDKTETNDYDSVETGEMCALCRSHTEDGSTLENVALLQPCRTLRAAKLQDLEQQLQTKRLDVSDLTIDIPIQPSFEMSASPKLSDSPVKSPVGSSDKLETSMDDDEGDSEGSMDAEDDYPEFPNCSFRNIDSMEEFVHIQVCGHKIHDDCFRSFLATNAPNSTANQILEFPCPICRRLSNVLLPNLSREHFHKPSSLVNVTWKDSVVKFLTSLTKVIPTEARYPQVPSAQVSEMVSVSQKLGRMLQQLSFHPKTTKELIPTVWETCIGNLALLELPLRHDFVLSVNQIESVVILLKNTLVMSEQLRSLTVWMSLVTVFGGESVVSDSELQLTQPPLLSTEIYGSIMRMFFAVPHAHNIVDSFLPIVYVGYLAVILQALLKLHEKYGPQMKAGNLNEKFPTTMEPAILTKLLSVITHFDDEFSSKCGLFLMERDLIAEVQGLVSLYLRRCSLTRQIVSILDSGVETAVTLSSDFDTLRNSLQCPTVSEACQFLLTEGLTLTEKWLKDYSNVYTRLPETWLSGKEQKKMLPASDVFDRLATPLPTKLLDLTLNFQHLMLKFLNAKCSFCKTHPKNDCICLVCGQYLCAGSQCCQSKKVGECQRHSHSCGGGLFLMMKGSFALILREDKRSVWGGLYLDDHGEEDTGLKRGRPLYLNQKRYKELLRLWLTQSFDHDSKIVQNSVRDGYLF